MALVESTNQFLKGLLKPLIDTLPTEELRKLFDAVAAPVQKQIARCGTPIHPIISSCLNALNKTLSRSYCKLYIIAMVPAGMVTLR